MVPELNAFKIHGLPELQTTSCHELVLVLYSIIRICVVAELAQGEVKAAVKR